jgi:hypothetical protein
MKCLPLLVLLLFVGCATHYRESIRSVLHQRDEAARKAVSVAPEQENPGRTISPSREVLYSLASRIVISHCPKDFQSAWADYLFWLGQCPENPGGLSAFAHFVIPGGAASFFSDFGRASGKSAEAQQNTDVALRRLDQIAAQYGTK